MEIEIKQLFDDLGSKDDRTRMDALRRVLELTEKPVEWAYEVWDGLFEKLEHPNSFIRSIAVMVLCNLAKSDTEKRLRGSLDRLLEHTRDEKFITSRQCIQSIWKVAAEDRLNRERIIFHLQEQFHDCISGRHPNLIRRDIIGVLKALHDHLRDEALLDKARELLRFEVEDKYRKTYQAILDGPKA